MATFVNDLRLTELATGEGSGTWGTTTNQSLELIGEALGYATQQAFSSDADATTTVADGVSDPARAMYFKVTSAGSLSATRTLTIAPNTISRVMFIENATTGSQSIAISQGSGANVTIAAGKTAVVYLDGAGSGAAVVDALALVDPGVTDTLTEVLVAGNTSGGTNIELSTTDKVQFRDTGIYINSSADGQLDIVADTEIQIAATTVDLNGNLDVSGTTVSAGKITADAGIDIDNINIDGTTIALSSGDLTLDVAGDIILDADGGDIRLHDGGVLFGKLTQYQTDFYIDSSVTDRDMFFRGIDGGIQFVALTLDMSEAGAATFNSSVTATSLDISGDIDVDGTTNLDVVDIDGAVNMASTALVTGVLTTTAQAVFNGGFDGNAKATINTADGLSSDYALIITNGETTAGQNFGLRVRGGSNASDVAFTVETYDNGSDLFRMYGNGQSSFHNGTAALPSITNIGDLNTGIWFPADDKIAASTAGVERFRINDIGGVTFTAAATGHSTFNEGGVDADFRVESDGNANMLFVDGGNDRVGVGTTTRANLSSSVGSTAALQVEGLTAANSSASVIRNANSVNGPYLSLGKSRGTGLGGTTIVQSGDQLGVISFLGSDGTDLEIGAQIIGTVNGTPGANDMPGALAFLTTADGAVTPSERMTISSSGAITINGGLTVGTGVVAQDLTLSDNTPTISMTDTDSNADALIFTDGGTGTGALFISADHNDEAAGSYISLKVDSAELAQLKASEVIFNEDSRNQDFRVESDSNTHMLFVDAGNNRVGVGLSAPTRTLHVADNSADPYVFVDGSAGNRDSGFSINAGAGQKIAVRGDSSGSLFYGNENQMLTNSTGVAFNEGSADLDFRVESDSNGYMLFVDAGTNVVAVGGNVTADPWTGYSPLAVGSNLMIGSTGASSTYTNFVHGGYWNGSAWLQRYTDVTQSRHEMIGAQAGSTHNFYTSADVDVDTTVTEVKNLSLYKTESVFNEDSNSAVDFRIESNNKSHMLYVDSSLDFVGFETSIRLNSSSTTGFLAPSGGICMETQVSGGDGYYAMWYHNLAGTQTGYIYNNGSSTAYNTASDGRLKENILDAEDAGSLIDDIQVRSFDWKETGEHQRYGMIAQELQTVAPEAVHEPEDADAMMAVDYSILVPMLIKEIQSLRARVADLES